jgi:hypothetical protein
MATTIRGYPALWIAKPLTMASVRVSMPGYRVPGRQVVVTEGTGLMTERQKAGSPVFPRDAEQARLDLELTRQEIGETVEGLVHKLDIPSRVRATVDARLDQAVARVAQVVSEPAAERFRHVVDLVRRNPLPTAGALVVAVLVVRFVIKGGTR